MNLSELKKPFPESEIEWRVGQCGKNGSGVWASCLAYVSARAIMNRLDDVCGPENWRAEYSFINGVTGIDPGVICKLSIKVGDAWVTKEDGAEQTDIESFKGGISSALKRAGSAWGIGRYLYGLDSAYAKVVTDKKGANWGKSKDGTEFFWLPPALPAWALPDPSQAKGLPNVKPEQPSVSDGYSPMAYTITFGKFARKTLEQVESDEPGALASYIAYLENSAAKPGAKPLSATVIEFIQRAEEYLGALETAEVES